jgi:hypothetical protein
MKAQLVNTALTPPNPNAQGQCVSLICYERDAAHGNAGADGWTCHVSVEFKTDKSGGRLWRVTNPDFKTLAAALKILGIEL